MSTPTIAPRPAAAAPPPGAPASQTLSRGIRILEILADAAAPLSIDDVAESLGVHRSVAYRLVRTLEDHGLLVRDASGRLALGARLAALAARVAGDLQSAARPELMAAADDLGQTCFLVVLDHDECVTLVSIEPRRATTSVAQHPGSRHPLGVGAPGKAILSLLPRALWPADVPAGATADVAGVTRTGFASSHDEVIPHLGSVAVPLAVRGRAPAALAVVYLTTDRTASALAERLVEAAAAIRTAIDG